MLRRRRALPPQRAPRVGWVSKSLVIGAESLRGTVKLSPQLEFNMQKRQVMILVGASLCAALVLAQPLSSTVPLATQEHHARHEQLGFSWQFWVNGKNYAAKLSIDQIVSAPDWMPSSPLAVHAGKSGTNCPSRTA
jgi:hypothetical protein